MNRLKNKEGIVAIIIAIIHFALWYYFAYVRFDVNNVKSYKYILGLPEWFFLQFDSSKYLNNNSSYYLYKSFT